MADFTASQIFRLSTMILVPVVTCVCEYHKIAKLNTRENPYFMILASLYFICSAGGV